MSEAGAIAVVVVAHYSAATLRECVDAALGADGVAELVVVDNATRDGSIEAFERAFAQEPRVRVLRNADNAGFAAACNQGAAATRAPWLAFLNPDCLVERGTFAAMQALSRERPDAGLVGADVRDATGAREPAARRREPGWRRALARVLGDPSALLLRAPDDGRAASVVDATSGALMLLRRELFDRVGGFDSGYRLHCEDLDLCRRVRDAGLLVLVAEHARATHLQGGSSRRRPLFVAFQKHRGMQRYFRKHERAAVPVPLALLIQAGIWLRFAAMLPLLAVRDLAARLR
ncbi:MAG TPA: glycosyltransferase family 2 protein [Xanthomonadales bacterium]|nr:glycosyltransferase family 2 protein [Xanthomonadales bacterium]